MFIDATAYRALMQFGLFLQPLHHPSENPTGALERDLALVQLLDELGYAQAWIGEHHSTGWENIAAPDAFIAAVAERTSQIALGTGVLQLGLHHPLVSLDRMIFLDHLTKGRARFGMGVGGGIPSDLTVFGLTTETAGRRMQESVDAMMRLLEAEEPITIESDWFEIHDAVLQLRPFTSPHMPFAVASSDSRNVELMGRVGGQVLLGSNPAAIPDVMDSLDAGADQAGREASRDQVWMSMVMHVDEVGERARQEFKEGAVCEFYEFQVAVNGRPEPPDGPDAWYEQYLDQHVIGSPADAIEHIERVFADSGGVGGIIFMAREWAGVERSRDSWRLFAEEVAPHFADH